MRVLINDIKCAFRQLLKNPGFTAMVGLKLALCIGVNTAMLGALYRVVLKPLPLFEPWVYAAVEFLHLTATPQIRAM